MMKQRQAKIDLLDKLAIELFIEREGKEAYESGEIGETLERIHQFAREYDEVFLQRHPEIKGSIICVYHDPLAGEDLAVINTHTNTIVEILDNELKQRYTAAASKNYAGGK